ncbi:uncharacterized protein LOC114351791 [Ostrinia furnacalis]|uniref:uncharacterized protein LOC114351791 n=1 Tax=Ostrinia furnacalis TaxID=93504 RepID=UPI00103DA4C5|nr:uncharacterized protein LOC114351791 [Ostrinia furnacalis]
MLGLRSALIGTARARTVLRNAPLPLKLQKKYSHHDGPPQPFDNMPFRITNRFLTTVFFAVFFGSGLWAPFAIVWYSMAKRTL